jgi:hypothetical protein
MKEERAGDRARETHCHSTQRLVTGDSGSLRNLAHLAHDPPDNTLRSPLRTPLTFPWDLGLLIPNPRQGERELCMGEVMIVIITIMIIIMIIVIIITVIVLAMVIADIGTMIETTLLVIVRVTIVVIVVTVMVIALVAAAVMATKETQNITRARRNRAAHTLTTLTPTPLPTPTPTPKCLLGFPPPLSQL